MQRWQRFVWLLKPCPVWLDDCQGFHSRQLRTRPEPEKLSSNKNHAARFWACLPHRHEELTVGQETPHSRWVEPSIPSRPARTYGPVPYLLANRAGKAWGPSAPLRWGWWHTPAWLTNSATGLTWIQFNAGQLGSGYGGKLSSNQCPKSNFWAWLAVD